MRWLPIVYWVVVVTGLGFVAARPRYVVADSWPQQSFDSKGRNLAHLAAGARVIVSSYDAAHGRHPLFAIDGEVTASAAESWASEPDDRKPWLRVEFARRADVEAVQVAYPNDATFPLEATLRCERRDQGQRLTVASHPIVDRTPDATPHSIDCRDSDSVLLEFEQSFAHASRPIAVAEVVVTETAR
jgi:hypothetical protein